MFEGFEGALCHADDVLVYGRNREEHDQRLHRVLQKMQDEGLTLNEKCEFAKEHTISSATKSLQKASSQTQTKSRQSYRCQSQHVWRTLTNRPTEREK